MSLKETPGMFKFRGYGTELIYKYNLEYLLKIMRNLYGRLMNEEDRRRILEERGKEQQPGSSGR